MPIQFICLTTSEGLRPTLNVNSISSFCYLQESKLTEVTMVNGDIYRVVEAPETIYLEILTKQSE